MISIITPSYNQRDYIGQTIHSVLSQKATDCSVQYIIIDGNSTDGTQSVIQRYSLNIDYWISERDNGQSQAINKGFSVASGDIVNWINSDDLLEQNALRQVAEIYSKIEPEVGLIHGCVWRFSNVGIIDIESGYKNVTLERYLSGMAFSQPSAFFRRKLLDKVGLLDETLHYGMDYDLFARLALVTKFKKVPNTFAKYRIHEQSKTSAGNKKFIDDWAVTFIRVLKTLDAVKQLEELYALGRFNAQFERVITGYEFDFDRPQVDLDLMMFYFLSYVFQSDYRNSQYEQAAAMGKYLKKRYPSRLVQDAGLTRMVRRLEYLPGPIIEMLRKLKAGFK